ncbi:permease [bacterium]|nr:permease [bacterium]
MADLYFQIRDLFENTYTSRIVSSFVQLLLMVGPYFILSVLLNVVIRRWMKPESIDFQGKSRVLFILSGGLFGLISPFPTYIAVPMGVAFLSAGLPFGAAVAFMVSSPLMNPGIFLLTLTQLGWRIAVARIVSAFLLAMAAGLLSDKMQGRIQTKPAGNDVKKDQVRRSIWIETRQSVLFLGKYFVLALILSALVRALIPAELITRILGGRASMSLVAAIAMGVPFYTCGGAAIPLVQVLGEMGMNRGAILAFFIAGPSTKIETMMVYRSVMGLKFFLLYLTFILSGAFLCGFIFMTM